LHDRPTSIPANFLPQLYEQIAKLAGEVLGTPPDGAVELIDVD
jgi:hypothetical protein